MQEQNVATESKKCSLKCKLVHLIAALLIVIGFSYFAWQNYQIKHLLATQTQQLSQQIQQQSSEKISLKTETSNPSWDLLEVQYLIRLADIHLSITKNIPQSIQLLTLADNRLATLIASNPNLVMVRQALADNISALKLITVVDQVGIILKINALSDQIDKLPMPSLPSKLAEPQHQVYIPATRTSQTFWQKFETASWEQLQNIIIVKHHEQPIIPILSEEQQIDLLQRIQLALNQAEWAVLHKQSTVYQASLQKVITLTNRYFSNAPSIANNIIASVKELQVIELNPKIPDISSSLQAIDKVINQSSGNAAS